MKYNIEFIEREKLHLLCKNVIITIKESVASKEKTLHDNIIDPFSAIFEASCSKISLQEWLQAEEKRQIQKTLQNSIGTFHQKVLSSVSGWKDLGTGNIVDIVNEDRKVIAEIKNKFNTTKGNHKIAVYDDFSSLLSGKYKGYVAYYVAILTKRRINKPFTPSDNKLKSRRSIDESIREIDGSSFYEIVTGDKDGLYKIYQVIPLLISEILNQDTATSIIKDPLFEDLFQKAFNRS